MFRDWHSSRHEAQGQDWQDWQGLRVVAVFLWLALVLTLLAGD